MSAPTFPALCLLLICQLLTGPLAWAGFVSPELPDDLARLREAGPLRIAVLEQETPPFVFTRDGQLVGADVDLARDFAESLDLKATFVKISGGYDDLIQAVAANEADIGLSELSKTMHRAQGVFFSRPYLVSGFTLLANRLSLARMRSASEVGGDPARFAELFNVPERSIATMSGSATVEMLADLFPTATHVATATWLDSAQRVVTGEVDGALLPDSAYRTIFHANPALAYKVQAQSLQIDDPLVIAVRPGLPDLLRLVNDYLDVTSGTRRTDLDSLLLQYLGPVAAKPVEHLSPDAAAEPPLADSPNWALLGGLHVLAGLLFWALVIRRGGPTHWLLSPWAVLGGMLLGGVTGVLHPALAELLTPPAAIYLNFWRLCVLPIMITTVVTSVCRLLMDGNNARLVKRLLAVIPLALLTLAALGLSIGLVGQPGADFPETAQQVLLKDVSINQHAVQHQGVYEQFIDMAHNIVPDNLLKPVVENQSLAVLFVALLFGIMLARCAAQGRDTVMHTLETILQAFTSMIRLSLYLLPLALYALALDFMAQTGLELLGAILRLTVCMTIALLLPMVFAFGVLRLRLRSPFKTLLKEFGSMLLVAFSARSSVIAMPLGLEALGRFRNINQEQAMAAFPLALLICHCGYAAFFTLTPLFIGQVFGVEFTLGQYGFILLGAVLSTVASIGTIGLSFVTLLSIVCVPLGLPLEPAMLVGLALVAITDPLISASQVIFGCGVTTLLVEDQAEPAPATGSLLAAEG